MDIFLSPSEAPRDNRTAPTSRGAIRGHSAFYGSCCHCSPAGQPSALQPNTPLCPPRVAGSNTHFLSQTPWQRPLLPHTAGTSDCKTSSVRLCHMSTKASQLTFYSQSATYSSQCLQPYTCFQMLPRWTSQLPVLPTVLSQAHILHTPTNLHPCSSHMW